MAVLKCKSIKEIAIRLNLKELAFRKPENVGPQFPRNEIIQSIFLRQPHKTFNKIVSLIIAMITSQLNHHRAIKKKIINSHLTSTSTV